MFSFTQKVAVSPLVKSKGKNNCKYIVLHHTGTKNYKGELNVLSGKNYNPNSPASCHFLVWPKWETAKIGEPTDILRHVWVSARGNEWKINNSLNRCCLGIEITWPLDDGWFTTEQKVIVKKLVEHLMAVYSIPQDRILRHCDLTHKWSIKKEYWKIWTVGRKWDVAHTFFPRWDFLAWRASLIPLSQ